MIILGLAMSAIALFAYGTAKLGAHENDEKQRARENKHAESTRRARERAQVLASDRAARLSRDGARAARIARGGVAI